MFLLVWLDPFMLRMLHICGPVFHCYSCPLATVACPIGILGHFAAWHMIPFIALGTLILFGAMIGTAVCGWMCPFGLLQDLIGKTPVRKFNLPNWTGYGRYAVLLGLVVAIPFFFGIGHWLFFCSICPAGALEGGMYNVAQQASAGEPIVWPNAIKMTILIGLVVSAVFFMRPWCTVLCPLGGIFALFNRFSAFSLRFRHQSCRTCGSCDTRCRYGVLPAKDVNNARCIRCLECTDCNALTIGTVFDRQVDNAPKGPVSLRQDELHHKSRKND
jgi:polyferredoxin